MELIRFLGSWAKSCLIGPSHPTFRHFYYSCNDMVR